MLDRLATALSGVTVLIATVGQANLRLADRVLRLDSGHLVAADPAPAVDPPLASIQRAVPEGVTPS